MKKVLQVITSVPALIVFLGLLSLWLNVEALPKNIATIGLGAVSGLIIALPIIKVISNLFEQEDRKDINLLDSAFSRFN